jgi:hypothetical protein
MGRELWGSGETRPRQVSPAWTEMRKGDRQGQHPPASERLEVAVSMYSGVPNSSSQNSVTTRSKTPLASSFPRFPRGFGCFRPTRIRAQAQASSASLDPAPRVHSRAIVAAAWAIVDVFQVEHRRYHLHVRAAAIQGARGYRGRAGRQAGRDVLCVRLGGCDLRCSHVASDELQRTHTAGIMMTRMPRPTFASTPSPSPAHVLHRAQTGSITFRLSGYGFKGL